MKMKFKKVLSLILIGCLVSINGLTTNEINAATKSVAISKKNFPDTNFRTFVKKFDKNKDGKLSSKEISKVKKLVINENKISNIKELVAVSKIKSFQGINTFSNVRSIDLVNKNIKSLSLKLPKLTELRIDCSSLQKIKISSGENIDFIQIDNYNQPFKLDCGKFKNLLTLVIAGDAEIVFDALGLEKCEKLSYLGLFNQLKADEIDLTKLTELQTIHFEGTVKKIDASGLEKLELMKCSGLGMEELNVTGCSSLKSLYCRRNNLKSLDISGLDKLEKLHYDKDVEVIGETENIPNVRVW